MAPERYLGMHPQCLADAASRVSVAAATIGAAAIHAADPGGLSVSYIHHPQRYQKWVLFHQTLSGKHDCFANIFMSALGTSKSKIIHHLLSE